jgi:hypothetical protein
MHANPFVYLACPVGFGQVFLRGSRLCPGSEVPPAPQPGPFVPHLILRIKYPTRAGYPIFIFPPLAFVFSGFQKKCTLFQPRMPFLRGFFILNSCRTSKNPYRVLFVPPYFRGTNIIRDN